MQNSCNCLKHNFRAKKNSSNLVKKYSYAYPPKGETPYDFKNQKYYREFKRCKKCGHFFNFHNLNLEDLYKKDYLNTTYKNVQGMKKTFNNIISIPFNKSDNKNRVSRLISLLKKEFKKDLNKIKILDVGSGLGVFPYELRKKNFSVNAIEQDSRAVEYLQKYAGIKSYQYDFLKKKKNNLPKYNLITLNKVLEHLENPTKMLLKVKQNLTKNGFLYIELPDAKAQVLGKNAGEFEVEHFHVFSKKSVLKLLYLSGFKAISLKSIIEPSKKYTIYAFAKKIN